jgi:hypothetical protein
MTFKKALIGVSAAIFLVTLASSASAVCRQLVPGERWYNGWVSCCDTPTGSVWVRRSNGARIRYNRSCASYGIHGRPGGGAQPAGRICRALRPGDRWYGRWAHCCDTGDGRSVWTARDGRRGVWRGTCRSWGVQAGGGQQGGFHVCRALRPGDPYYRNWAHCCDTGRGTSYWTNRAGRRTLWRGTCRRWGIR